MSTAAADPGSASGGHQDGRGAGRLDIATILIVDDLADNREVLVRTLRQQGHWLLEAANGREALAAVHAGHPDLVITDVLMPVMDGYEFVRRLRLDPITSRLPVMFYTPHYGEREARALALSSGVSAVLTKPADPEEVLKIVGRVLSGELVPGMRSGASPLTTEFDREHLGLLTGDLSDEAGGLRAANSRLRALINIGLELASERDPDRLLQHVCAAARELFGATYVTLGILDRNDRTVRRCVACGTDAASWIRPGDSVPGILGTVVAGRRALRGDVRSDDPARLKLLVLHPDAEAFLAAPIASPAHVYGWICLFGNDGRIFADDDEHLVLALAGQVGRICELEHEIVERQQAESAAKRSRLEAERALGAAAASMRATRASERLKSAILDVSLDCVVTMDHHGLVTEFNAAAERTFGYSRGQVLGKLMADLIIPVAYRDAHDRGLQRYLTSGEGPILGKRLELTAIRRDGTEFPVEVAIIQLPVAGDPVFTGFLRDITERKRAEEELRNRAALSALDAAIGLSLNDATSLADALQQCAEALVIHLGAAFARIWTLNERDGVLELQASAGLYTHLNGAHGKVPLGELKIGRIAGARTPHLTNSVIGDPEVSDQAWAQQEGMVAFAGHPLVVDGRVIGVVALFARHPLSEAVFSSMGSVSNHIALGIERHRNAEALQIAEERMRFALDAAGVGIWDLDCTTGVVRWSATLEAQQGLEPGTFEGTLDALLERIHPDDRTSLLATAQKAMKSGGDFSVMNRTIRPDGTVRWLSGSGRVHLGEHGEPVRAVGISQDVTEHKRVEAEVRLLNDQIQLQRLRVFKATMRTVQDLVNNLLNSFQLVRLEAGDQIPAEVLTLLDRTIQEAALKLKTLGNLETVNEKEMAAGLGIDYPGASS